MLPTGRMTVLMPALVAAALAAMTGSAFADATIAVNGPITGPYAVFGDQMKRGAEFAAAEINAKGGLLGQQIKTLVGDDACDPKQAVSVANKDVTEGVKVVIGHYCSGSSIPASAVYQEANMLQITPASTNPKFTDEAAAKGWWNVFRTCGRDDTQGVTDARFLVSHYKDKRIAVLHDKSPYGKGLADETVKGLEKAGVKPAMYEAYNPGEKDYTAIITLPPRMWSRRCARRASIRKATPSTPSRLSRCGPPPSRLPAPTMRRRSRNRSAAKASTR